MAGSHFHHRNEGQCRTVPHSRVIAGDNVRRFGTWHKGIDKLSPYLGGILIAPNRARRTALNPLSCLADARMAAVLDIRMDKVSLCFGAAAVGLLHLSWH